MRQYSLEEWRERRDAAADRRWTAWGMYAIAAATPLLVFVLPLFVPTPPANTISASYVSGFNNRVAIVSAVALSVAMLVLAWWHRETPDRIEIGRPALPELSRRLVAAVVGGTALVQGFAGWVILQAHGRNLGDAGYIIEQATVRADTGRALYTQIEFAYGPLLLFPEIWLHRLLGCSVSAAYFGLLMLQSALGLLMVAYLLNRLPIRGSLLRTGTFVCVAAAAITPHWGMNYTLFRFASPMFVVVWATRARSPWRCSALLAAGVLVELSISPELGLALAAGVLCFGVIRTVQSGWRWAGTFVLPLAVLAAVLLTLGRPYLRMASIFTRGALNLPVGPYPHVLLFLVALVWLVPRMLGRRVNLHEESSATLLACYAVAVAFVPAALGRCDPLHVMFNGTGLWVLAPMAFEGSRMRLRAAWVACMAFVVLWDHRVNDRLFQFQDMVMLRKAILDRLPPREHDTAARILAHRNPYREYLLSREAPVEQPVDLSELMRFIGRAPVVTPAEISPDLEEQLRQAHLYSPGFFAFWSDTMNEGTEQRIVDFVNAHEWMLLPASWEQGYLQMPRDTGLFQGLNLHYKQRKPVLYCPGALFNADVQEHWSVAWSFGSYLLYKHTDHSPAIKVSDMDRDCDQLSH